LCADKDINSTTTGQLLDIESTHDSPQSPI
jgi:hypothetical protein